MIFVFFKRRKKNHTQCYEIRKKVQFWDIIQYLMIIASSNARLFRCNIFETRTTRTSTAEAKEFSPQNVDF